jgi:hypothetical protein
MWELPDNPVLATRAPARLHGRAQSNRLADFELASFAILKGSQRAYTVRSGSVTGNHPHPPTSLRRIPFSVRLKSASPYAAKPSKSKSLHDATRRGVGFWGYDSAMEAAFFVSEEALRWVQPDVRLDETGLLGAFDANRDLIYAIGVEGLHARPQGPL